MPLCVAIEDRLGLTSTYAYNDDLTLKSLTLPNGTVTGYTYDDLRRLVSIATTGLNASDIIVKFAYEYNDLGLRDKVTMHDGRSIEWDYDDVGRLVEEHFKSDGPSPETLLRYVYEYDGAGNRTSKKTDYDDDNGSYAATTTYTNNGYNQLTGVSGTRGNRINVSGTIPTAWTLTDGDVTVTPNSTPGNAVDAEVRGRFFIARNVELSDSDSNQLVASTSATTLGGNSPSSDTVLSVALESDVLWTYSYSANGDLALMESTVHNSAIQWSYTYSVDDWLTRAVKIVDGETELTEEYFYDPVGRKHKTSVTEDQTTTTRYFVFDGGCIILELELDTGNYILDREHVRGASLGGGIGGLLYTRDASGSVGYFHYDGQGNVVSVTDAAREEIAYYEYDAWGNILTACGSLANEFAFSTKQASTNTGLIDFGYRWYDPQTGRWLQRDPLGPDAISNLYAFADGDPVNNLDAYGLQSMSRKEELDFLDNNVWRSMEDRLDECSKPNATEPQRQEAKRLKKFLKTHGDDYRKTGGKLAQLSVDELCTIDFSPNVKLTKLQSAYMIANAIALKDALDKGDKESAFIAGASIASTLLEAGIAGAQVAQVMAQFNAVVIVCQTPQNIKTITLFVIEFFGLAKDLAQSDLEALFPHTSQYNAEMLDGDINDYLDDLESRCKKKHKRSGSPRASSLDFD